MSLKWALQYKPEPPAVYQRWPPGSICCPAAPCCSFSPSKGKISQCRRTPPPSPTHPPQWMAVFPARIIYLTYNLWSSFRHLEAKCLDNESGEGLLWNMWNIFNIFISSSFKSFLRRIPEKKKKKCVCVRSLRVCGPDQSEVVTAYKIIFKIVKRSAAMISSVS